MFFFQKYWIRSTFFDNFNFWTIIFWNNGPNFCQVGILLFPKILNCTSIGPKWFWTNQIVLDGYKLFWLGPNHFGRVQIIFERFKLDFSGLTFIIWACPKWFGPVQNNFYYTKMIWKVQNHFGLIEGLGINLLVTYQ